MSTIVTNSPGGSATFDRTRRYRYTLSRFWMKDREHSHRVIFIMLNPSQANATDNDPTIRACSQFAQAWGYPQLEVVNLFAYRTPHPSALAQAEDPIGPDNDRYLLAAAAAADKIILAWGNWGSFLNRDQAVVTLLTPHSHKLYCLIHNRSGQPRHPLYVSRMTVPQRWHRNNLSSP